MAEVVTFPASDGVGTDELVIYSSLDAPVAMGYLPAGLAAPGTPVWAEVRGRRLPCTVRPLPFRPSTYKR